jgi:hypothetical protein
MLINKQEYNSSLCFAVYQLVTTIQNIVWTINSNTVMWQLSCIFFIDWLNGVQCQLKQYFIYIVAWTNFTYKVCIIKLDTKKTQSHTKCIFIEYTDITQWVRVNWFRWLFNIYLENGTMTFSHNNLNLYHTFSPTTLNSLLFVAYQLS